MTQEEIRLIEEGGTALVERLGLAEATRFIMLIDRRTGGALQHLQHLCSGTVSGAVYNSGSVTHSKTISQLDA